jgi:hypothetical protein
MQPFGRIGFVTDKTKIKAKLDDRSFKCFFVGYADNHARDAYRMYNPVTKRVIVTRDVFKWGAWHGNPRIEHDMPVEARETEVKPVPSKSKPNEKSDIATGPKRVKFAPTDDFDDRRDLHVILDDDDDEPPPAVAVNQNAAAPNAVVVEDVSDDEDDPPPAAAAAPDDEAGRTAAPAFGRMNLRLNRELKKLDADAVEMFETKTRSGRVMTTKPPVR